MSRVITFSRYFPAYHPRKGQPTYFVEGILTQLDIDYTSHEYFIWLVENNKDVSEIFLNDFFMSLSQDVIPKSHTIRNHKRPVIVGGSINPKCWAGKPYHKTPEGFWQIKFAPDIEVKKVWRFKMIPALWEDECKFYLDENHLGIEIIKIAYNDGLEPIAFMRWFTGPGIAASKRAAFNGQIICWNEKINY